MKKITIFSMIVMVALLGFYIPAMAATNVTLSPANINVAVGSSFNVAVSVNPQGTSNYAEKVELNFPADVLEVSSFSLGSNWMALTQSGYEVTDNTNGILTRTAGYPSGITGATPFGTITFRAKKSGSGVIRIGSNSIAFEANAQSTMTGNNISVTITSPVVTPKSSPVATKTPIATVTQTVAPTSTPTLSTEPVAQLTPVSQVAAVSEAVPQEDNNSGLWIVLIIIILAIIGSVVYVSLKGKK